MLIQCPNSSASQSETRPEEASVFDVVAQLSGFTGL